MQKFLQKDQLAREEHILYIPGAKIFEIRAEQGLPQLALPTTDADFLQNRMHGICVGEIEAMEGAGRTVCDFEDVPWEFTLDMARQVWDESRHTEIYERLLRHVQSTLGEYPESRILWDCACAEDPAARVAGVNRGLEGLACDVFAQLISSPKSSAIPSSSGPWILSWPMRLPMCVWAAPGCASSRRTTRRGGKWLSIFNITLMSCSTSVAPVKTDQPIRCPLASPVKPAKWPVLLMKKSTVW